MTITVIDKGFSIVEALLGDAPRERFSILVRGHKGRVSIPVSVSLEGLNQTELSFAFKGNWIEIHYSV